MAGLYGRMSPDDIFVAAGAQEAIFLFFTAVLKRGEAVIVHYPAYQSLYQAGSSLHEGYDDDTLTIPV